MGEKIFFLPEVELPHLTVVGRSGRCLRSIITKKKTNMADISLYLSSIHGGGAGAVQVGKQRPLFLPWSCVLYVVGTCPQPYRAVPGSDTLLPHIWDRKDRWNLGAIKRKKESLRSSLIAPSCRRIRGRTSRAWSSGKWTTARGRRGRRLPGASSTSPAGRPWRNTAPTRRRRAASRRRETCCPPRSMRWGWGAGGRGVSTPGAPVPLSRFHGLFLCLQSKMTWGPYFWFHMWRAATSTISGLSVRRQQRHFLRP